MLKGLTAIFFIFGTLQAAVVEGILFYGESCPHCHEVIEKVMPSFVQKYGDQLDIRLVNVGTKQGHQNFEIVLEWLNIPVSEAGIPALVIDRTLLLGSVEIPKKLPNLIESHLASGTHFPPGLDLSEAVPLTQTTTLKAATIADKIGSDPVGSSLAIVLSFVMAGSLVSALLIWRKNGFPVKSPRVTPFLAAFGLLLALYLSYLELTGNEGICGPIGNCHGVQQSPWSRILGIPVGILGSLGYAMAIAFWFLQKKTWILPVFFLIGTLFSLYLTLLEPFVIGAICFLCLTSASLMTLLLWLHIPAKQKNESS